MTDPLEKTDAMPAIAVAAPIVTPWYLDRAVWMTLLVPACAMLNARLGLGVDPAVMCSLVLPVAAFIVAHKWKSGLLQKAVIDNAADAAAELSKP